MMDRPDLDIRRHVQALDALGRANVISRTDAAIWPSIRAASRDAAHRPLRVLDIASGGGHLLLSLARRAERERVAFEWLGWDLSPVAIDYARTLARRRGVKGVRFELADALCDPMPAGIDVVLCTLFLHHLTEADAAARRTRLGAAFTRVGCRMLSQSEVFHVDGVRSVAAAFTTDEARGLAAASHLRGALVSQIWPQRWILTWRKPA
jgi:SAM-dependent methyltransferase